VEQTYCFEEENIDAGVVLRNTRVNKDTSDLALEERSGQGLVGCRRHRGQREGEDKVMNSSIYTVLCGSEALSRAILGARRHSAVVLFSCRK